MSNPHHSPYKTTVDELVTALSTYPSDHVIRIDSSLTNALQVVALYDETAHDCPTIWDGATAPRTIQDAAAEPVTEHETREDDDALVTEGFLRLATAERERHDALGYDVAHDRKHGEAHLLQQAARLHAEGRPVEAYSMILAAVDAYTVMIDKGIDPEDTP